jgi:hypothetical protein
MMQKEEPNVTYLYTLQANPKSVVIGGTIFAPAV